jgi:hypothetical protein
MGQLGKLTQQHSSRVVRLTGCGSLQWASYHECTLHQMAADGSTAALMTTLDMLESLFSHD